MVTTRSAMKAAAPASSEEPASRTEAISVTGTPAPRGVLFEVTNAATPARKAFPDTPYPKPMSKTPHSPKAAKAPTLSETGRAEQTTSTFQDNLKTAISGTIAGIPRTPSAASRTDPLLEAVATPGLSRTQEPLSPMAAAGRPGAATFTPGPAFVETPQAPALTTPFTGSTSQSQSAAAEPRPDAAAASKHMEGEALISETVKHGEGEKEDTQSEQPVPTAELQNRDRTTLISKDVLVQAEKQASAIHADKGAPQAAIPQNPGQAAAGDAEVEASKQPMMDAPVLDILHQAKSISDHEGTGSESFKVLMEALNVASAKAAHVAGGQAASPVPTPDKIAEIAQLDPETAREIHSVMVTNRPSPLQSMVQPQLMQEPVPEVQERSPVSFPSPALSTGSCKMTGNDDLLATAYSPARPVGLYAEQIDGEKKSSSHDDVAMTPEHADRSPGRWVLEGPADPTPPQPMCLENQQRLKSEVRVPTATKIGAWDMRTPMREQEMETDVEESFMPTDGETDVEDDAFSGSKGKDGQGVPVASLGGQELVEAMDQLNIQTGRSLLRGVPDAQGQHLRFTDEGDAIQSPGNRNATVLKGMPAPTGNYTKFDD